MVRIFGIFNILILKYILYYNGMYFFWHFNFRKSENGEFYIF
jgi:hypothetical protein